MILKKENIICHKEISKLKSLIEDYKLKLATAINNNKEKIFFNKSELNHFDHFKSKLPSE